MNRYVLAAVYIVWIGLIVALTLAGMATEQEAAANKVEVRQEF